MRFVAGRGAVTESHREDVAGRGAVTESHLEDVAGRGAVAEQMAGSAMAKRMAALWQRAIGKILLAGAPWETMGAIEDRGRRRKPWAPSKTTTLWKSIGAHTTGKRVSAAKVR